VKVYFGWRGINFHSPGHQLSLYEEKPFEMAFVKHAKCNRGRQKEAASAAEAEQKVSTTTET